MCSGFLYCGLGVHARQTSQPSIVGSQNQCNTPGSHIQIFFFGFAPSVSYFRRANAFQTKGSNNKLTRYQPPLDFLKCTGMNFNFDAVNLVVQSSIGLNNKFLSKVVSWVLHNQLSEKEIRNRFFEMCFSSASHGLRNYVLFFTKIPPLSFLMCGFLIRVPCILILNFRTDGGNNDSYPLEGWHAGRLRVLKLMCSGYSMRPKSFTRPR